MRLAVLPPKGIDFPPGSPWDFLLAGLRSEGHHVDGFGVPQGQLDGIVALNHQATAAELKRTWRVRRSRCALIALEPRTTLPIMYQSRVVKSYGVRFAGSPRWAAALDAVPFLWPQDLTAKSTSGGDHTFDATMIVGDKRSAVSGSLYGLRRRVISEFDRSELALAVFGPGWESSMPARAKAALRATAKAAAAITPPDMAEAASDLTMRPANWLGTLSDKAAGFARAPVSIVIENSADYVSEKLVDAIAAGVIPIYVGPPLSEFSLPDGIAFPCPPRPDAILEAVRTLTQAERELIRADGRRWIASPEASEHDASRVLHALGFRIGRALADET